jgi:hypothetical protein
MVIIKKNIKKIIKKIIFNCVENNKIFLILSPLNFV